MKILFIKQLFYPEPTARSLDFAKALQEKGHEVEVLTGFPSYPQGKVYDGYKQRLYQRETIEGISVIRVPIFPDQSGRALYRILNYLSYAFTATMIGLWLVRKPDVVFAYHGALPVGIPAMVYRLFRGIPFVYDINDLWPDTLIATGMLKNKLLLSTVAAWCRLTYRQATHLTVLSQGFKNRLQERGVPAKKISVIHHWSRDKAAQPDPRIDALFANDLFHLVYAGNTGIAQNLTVAIDAAAMLHSRYPELLFTVIGDGVELETLRTYVQHNDIPNVRFLGRVTGADVGKYLSNADALLVHLRDEELFRITVPSKVIGYLFAGKPILAGLRGDAEQIIRDGDAGLIFKPDNTRHLTEQLEKMMSMTEEERAATGKNGYAFYQKTFTIENNTEKYIRLFDRISIKS